MQKPGPRWRPQHVMSDTPIEGNHKQRRRLVRNGRLANDPVKRAAYLRNAGGGRSVNLGR